MNILRNNNTKSLVIVFFFFLIASLLLFWPVLHKNFGSDDFSVLYRDVYKQGFYTKDFFRPLSDITLYWSYLMGNFNPFFYNLFNVIIHAACCFMLYYFCLQNNGLQLKNRSSFAWLSAILFLIYPFHNESIVWVLGRASMTSCFFGFLSLVTAFYNTDSFGKYYLSALFYFIGLCGYETILPLPGIILILLYQKRIPLKTYIPVTIVYTCSLTANIIIRYTVTGVIFGTYGSQMFEHIITAYLLKFLKVTGRLFLPPSNAPVLMGIFFVAIVIAIIVFTAIIIKKRDNGSFGYMKISFVFFLSAIVPLMFGLSTKTFEGDRVFYFTSFFLCVWIAYLFDYFNQFKFTWLIKGLIGIYFLFFFYKSIFAWKKAGEITGEIITAVKEIKREGGNIFLLNLPEEYNGAQVLRTSFTQALLINRVDTTGIKVINYLTTEFSLKTSSTITSEITDQGIYVFPGAIINENTIDARIRTDINSPDSIHVKYSITDKIYYWNKERLVLLKKPS